LWKYGKKQLGQLSLSYGYLRICGPTGVMGEMMDLSCEHDSGIFPRGAQPVTANLKFEKELYLVKERI
jgi:hypothetical protein